MTELNPMQSCKLYIWPFLAKVKQTSSFHGYILINFCLGVRVLYDNHWFTVTDIIYDRLYHLYPRIQRTHRISIGI